MIHAPPMVPLVMIKSSLKMKEQVKNSMIEWKIALDAHPQKVLTLNYKSME